MESAFPRDIRRARLEILANGGHLLIWTHTDQFIAHMQGFLEPRP